MGSYEEVFGVCLSCDWNMMREHQKKRSMWRNMSGEI